MKRELLAAMAMLLSGAALAQAPAPPAGAAVAPAASMATAASAGASADIRDIRGPKPIASGWWIPLLLAGGVAVVSAGCAAFAWQRRRRPLVRSPQEIALARLEAARALIQEGNSREYSIELSSITRQYIEDAFGIVATHLTTDEFLRHFANAPDSALIDGQNRLGEFLQVCDLAKFGGWNLTAAGMLRMLESARLFIIEPTRLRGPASQGLSAETNASRETYDSLPST
jgi:hypothetical protein